MKHFTSLFISLLMLGLTANAHPQNGLVAFDCPNVPKAEFQFDLDHRTIPQVIEGAHPDITALFNTLAHLNLRNYKEHHFDKMLRYYGTNLKARGWSAVEKNAGLHLYTLTQNETVIGVFMVVKSGAEMYLINMDGQLAPKQVSELVGNLATLGVDIPELNAFGERSDAVSVSSTLRMPEGDPIHEVRIQGDQKTSEPQIRKLLEDGPDELIAAIATLRSRLPDSQILTVRIDTEGPKRIATIIVTARPGETARGSPLPTRFRTSHGKPIHEVRVQGNRQISESEIRTALENGPADISKAIERLRNTLPYFGQVTLRIEEDGTRRIATISVAPLDTVNVPTRFRTATGKPIHEVRIRGNRKVTEAQIRTALENGPDEIRKATRHLRRTLPYFNRVNLNVKKDGARRVATITVTEKSLSSDYYLYTTPLIRFNRVTGWMLASRFELGRRKQMGELWMTDVPSSVRAHLPKLFSEVGYGFGNQDLNYRIGGTAIWGQPDIWNLGITAQIHRATTVIAPDLFPRHDSGLYIWYSLCGIPELHNYYLREGAQISLRWEPVVPTHSLRLTTRSESHESLQKTTDWHIGNWRSKTKARENPSITSGRLRSVTLRYDLNTRENNLGWHNTLLVEYSNPAIGSDFDFTRFQLHLRYALPKGENLARIRLMLGGATGALPPQRQFIIGGPGVMNGYPLYAFAGDHGALLNVEYFYRLSNLRDWEFLKKTFLVFFLDEGQVWNTSDRPYRFDPKADVGIGLQLGEEHIFRLNFAKPLESGRGVQFNVMYYYGF